LPAILFGLTVRSTLVTLKGVEAGVVAAFVGDRVGLPRIFGMLEPELLLAQALTPNTVRQSKIIPNRGVLNVVLSLCILNIIFLLRGRYYSLKNLLWKAPNLRIKRHTTRQ
jgi:hypothetical protein